MRKQLRAKEIGVNGESSRRHIRTAILILIVTFGLITSSCVPYDPTLFTGYDVLSPSEEVRKNPIGWVKDGKVVDDDGKEIQLENGIIINEAMSIWIEDLKDEIKRLREEN